MKTLFIIIGIVVVFSLLISSGGVSGGICIKGVGCVRSEGNGVKVDNPDGPVNIQAGRP